MKNHRQSLLLLVVTLVLLAAVAATPRLGARLRIVRQNRVLKLALKRVKAPAPLPVVGSYNNLRKLMRHAQSGGRGMMFGLNSGSLFGGAMEDSANVKMLGAAARGSEYSRTNVQVQGVDEADIVKTDGEYIYQIKERNVIITRVRPANAMKVTGVVKVGDSSFNPMELYVDDRYLVAIGGSVHSRPWPKQDSTSGSPEPRLPQGMDTPPDASIGSTKVFVYDISDKSAPKQVRDAEVEGDYISSRKIGSAVYLVANRYVDVYSLERSKKDIGLSAPAYKDSAGPNQFTDVGYGSIRYFPGTVEPNYLMVAGVRLDEPEKPMQVSTYLGAGQNIYASTENLYAAVSKLSPPTALKSRETTAGGEPSIPPGPPTINTQIYKFAFNNGETGYQGKGEVPGTILNQYSMDEFDGYFRLATTKGDPWGSDANTSKNNIYVLDRDLKIAGKLEDLAPGEKIYSARFMGDRAYLVTFKQVDPLFVIDLKEPGAPRVLGELKIPGYSDYLHPYDEDHIIGFGKEAIEEQGTALYQGMKVALFDVSDVAHPSEKFKTTIGDRGTDSELLHNPKALLFDKDKNLLAFPVTVLENKGRNPDSFGYGAFSFQGAYVYDLSLDKGLNLKGRISHQSPGDKGPGGMVPYGDGDKIVDRALYIGDTLYTVSKARIQANAIDDLKELGRVEMPK